MRRAAKIDANQQAIVQAMRQAGASVQSLAAVGCGCPDLLVGYRGRTALVECKDGDKPPSKQVLTEDQLKWHGAWRGDTLAVICDVDSALRLLRVMSAKPE